jgi:hypothetical protein
MNHPGCSYSPVCFVRFRECCPLPCGVNLRKLRRAAKRQRAKLAKERGGRHEPAPSPSRRVFVGLSIRTLPLKRAQEPLAASARLRVRPPSASRLWPSERFRVKEVEAPCSSPGSGRGLRACPPGLCHAEPSGATATLISAAPLSLLASQQCDTSFLPPLGTSPTPCVPSFGLVATSIPC